MAIDQSYSYSHADDDFIDIEVMSSSHNLICFSISSPPQSREFEFQMSSICNDKATTTSPADELFYKGKLLPLLLPPRLQMVEKLLQDRSTTAFESSEEPYSIPFVNPRCSTTTTTSVESCNISPSESRRISRELNPDEYFFDLSTELNSYVGHHTIKKSWTTKLKQCLLGQKLKASRAYLKSLFSKSGCTDESFGKPGSNVKPEAAPSGKHCLSKYMSAKKNSVSAIDSERCRISNTVMEKQMARDGLYSRRRSFSGAIQRHSVNNSLLSSSGSSSSSSSSSFSFSSSNGFCDLQLLKRSSSVNSERESSIEGAIAYCKKSHQQLLCSGKTETEHGFFSLSAASRISASGDQEMAKLCNI